MLPYNEHQVCVYITGHRSKNAITCTQKPKPRIKLIGKNCLYEFAYDCIIALLYTIKQIGSAVYPPDLCQWSDIVYWKRVDCC